jgi:hypothetical protein
MRRVAKSTGAATIGRWIGRQATRMVIASLMGRLTAYERSQRGLLSDLARPTSLDVFEGLRSGSRMSVGRFP